MKATYRLDDRTLTLEAEALPDGRLRVTLPNGEERAVTARRLPDDRIEVRDGDRVFVVPLTRAGSGRGNAVTVGWEGAAYAFTAEAPGRRAADSAGSGARSGTLTAPMVGVVAEVLAAKGDRVAAHQNLVVVEAMKVLARVEAPFAGVVRAVHVRPGDRVEHGQALAEVEPETGAAQ